MGLHHTGVKPLTYRHTRHVIPSLLWQTNRVHSYLPDIVPPSSLTRQPPYFQSISPPGLQYYTDALFSFFLPAFRAIKLVMWW